jgi:hypothetical protein
MNQQYTNVHIKLPREGSILVPRGPATLPLPGEAAGWMRIALKDTAAHTTEARSRQAPGGRKAQHEALQLHHRGGRSERFSSSFESTKGLTTRWKSSFMISRTVRGCVTSSQDSCLLAGPQKPG